MYKYLIISLIIFTFFSCKKEKETNQKTLEDSLKSEASDTTISPEENFENVKTLTDTSVIFFFPSPKERQKLTEIYGAYDQYQMNVVYSNFINLKNDVKSSLRKYNIKVQTSYAKKFIIPMQDDTIIYDLNVEDQIMGYILFDGQNMPVIKNGVQTKKQVTDDIRNYFNLPNYKLYE